MDKKQDERIAYSVRLDKNGRLMSQLEILVQVVTIIKNDTQQPVSIKKKKKKIVSLWCTNASNGQTSPQCTWCSRASP